jgi:hypothetical protein
MLLTTKYILYGIRQIKIFLGFGVMATPDGRRDTNTPPGRGMTNSW